MSRDQTESAALAQFYRRHGHTPIAYIDETYSVDPRFTQRFYVVSAVIVQPGELAPLRTALRQAVRGTFWHTTDQLLTESGREAVIRVLECLADPAGSEVTVVSHATTVDAADTSGEVARSRALRALFQACASPQCVAGQTTAFVLERRLTREQSNKDATTKAGAISDGLLPVGAGLLQVSPSDENLLWLPDVVCGAYRQEVLRREPKFFDVIREISTVVKA